MKRWITFILIWFFSLNCFAQKLKVLKPELGNVISYTKKQQKEWSTAVNIYHKVGEGKIIFDSLPAKLKHMIDIVQCGEGPMTLPEGDNWSSLTGGPYKVKSSSNLGSRNDMNIHDYSLFSAWRTKKDNNGIDENIKFYFKPLFPRVNAIIIYNGNFKNKYLWKEYSRVKQFELYINNKPYAILDLADTSASQRFSIPPVQSKIKGVDLVLKFKILSAYKGSKYSTVAISEIDFDGIDVLCLGKETKIRLADFKTKNIENIKPSDSILTYNIASHKIDKAKVIKVNSVIHQDLVKYYFQNGKTITATPDHPFLIKNKGWCSLQPDQTENYKGFGNVHKIKTGDYFITIDSPEKISTDKLVKIEYINHKQETYTISKISSGDNFIANGHIVGIEEMKNKKKRLPTKAISNAG